MIDTSSLYKSILSSSHRFEVRVDIDNASYGMDTLTSLRTSRTAFGSGSPALGLAPAGEISLSLYADSADIPRMAELRPYVRAVNDIQQSEWIPQGVYYIDTREVDSVSGLLTIHGYDAMLMAEKAYPSTTHDWPYPDLDVVNEIATAIGVPLDPRTTALMTAAHRIPLPAQYTMRETLQYIAALYGGSFVITDEGKLRLLCLWDRKASPDVTLEEGMYRLELSPDFPSCTGVRFLVDNNTEVFAGSDTGYVFEVSCPFATQQAANLLLIRMRDFVYRPYHAENAVLDPAAELGDTVSVGSSLSGLCSCDRNFDSLCLATVSAPEDKELDHEYPYESGTERRFTRQIKQVQSELTLQAQEISAKVSRTGGDASSFAWQLDADMFRLLADGVEVMRVDENGLSLRGVLTATGGSIGGCTIDSGVLKIANANIENINASKITAGTLSVARIASKSLTGGKLADETVSANKLADEAAINRVIGSSAVSYGKTSFQGTLDQVSTNQADIDTLYGYFTGAAQFSSVLAGSVAINGHYLGLETITIGGVNRKVVTWT